MQEKEMQEISSIENSLIETSLLEISSTEKSLIETTSKENSVQETNDKYPLLQTIKSPEDIKALHKKQIPELEKETRDFLVETIMHNGGHLASNLGVVELTIALHRVFNSPEDHIIFDVGHQCYAHKMFTGRMEEFTTIRQPNGLSGFPKREESPYDAFGTGHASTSLSAGLGFAEADKLKGSDAYTICVLGDGAYTGGMVHEALNNVHKKLHFIVVLNDNEMSISKNHGGFARLLSRLRTRKSYYGFKKVVSFILKCIPIVGWALLWVLKKVKRAMKTAVFGSNYFENLGLTYFGPVDGNDEKSVEFLLQEAKAKKGPCILHIKTKKGKGYAPAETLPEDYHGVLAENTNKEDKNTFSQEIGSILCNLGEVRNDVCAITAAMADGTGLAPFRSAFPNRFFDVGIAEEHAVTFSAGLAANGMRPFVAIYSTFLQRAYDNILHDVILQNLPVTFLVDRAGINQADGPTHNGVFDVAFLSDMPNVRIYTPATYHGLEMSVLDSLSNSSPAVIRYFNGYEDEKVKNVFYKTDTIFPGVRCSFDLNENLDVVIITHGRIASEAVRAIEVGKEHGVRVGVILLEMIKPYNTCALNVAKYLPDYPCKLAFYEEEILEGGFGMHLFNELFKYDVLKNKEIYHFGLTEENALKSCNKASIYEANGLDAESIIKKMYS